MKANYIDEDFGRQHLDELRQKYNLEKAVSSGKDEFEKQLLLKNWVFETLPLGYNNQNQYKNALEVLADKNNKGGFNCTWYVLVFLQAALALGWPVRKLGIDTDHKFGQEEMRHTVVEVWSKKHKKWYVVDPMFNALFEKTGIPLNAYEIRKAYLDEDKSIKKVFGRYEKEKLPKNVKDRHDKPANYFWFFILLKNYKALLWVDKFNRNKTWFVGGKFKGEFRKHPMYDGAFTKTNDYNLCYPVMSDS